MVIQFLLVIFIIFVLTRIFLRYRAQDITGREFFLWLIFWLIVAITILLPQKTDLLAKWVGVSRGADLLVYLSVLVLFFIIFKILVRLEKINRDLVKIVRGLTIEKEDKSNE
ncbi:MAG: DUF2304 domain-containing protein [Candidatus Buchananbacteria bacterium]|nr:DUF2304 domain-containing protein [Candidatus Buchananbacteria bacterium]